MGDPIGYYLDWFICCTLAVALVFGILYIRERYKLMCEIDKDRYERLRIHK